MMRRAKRGLVGYAALSLAMSTHLQAAKGPTGPASEATSDSGSMAVEDAAKYLDGLKSASGRFVQTDPDGRQETGRFWLLRPGRARFDYDPPSGLQIASDGRLVSVIDRRLKTVHNYPLGLTPLGLFLARDIRLDADVRILKVIDRPSALTIEVAARKTPDRGQIALQFSKAPLRLAGWALTDARGQTVQVSLMGLSQTAAMPKAFFDPPDPRREPTDSPSP